MQRPRLWSGVRGGEVVGLAPFFGATYRSIVSYSG